MKKITIAYTSALAIISALAFVLSLLVFSAAKGAIHEIFAVLILLVSTTSFGFLAIVQSIENQGEGK